MVHLSVNTDYDHEVPLLQGLSFQWAPVTNLYPRGSHSPRLSPSNPSLALLSSFILPAPFLKVFPVKPPGPWLMSQDTILCAALPPAPLVAHWVLKPQARHQA